MTLDRPRRRGAKVAAAAAASCVVAVGLTGCGSATRADGGGAQNGTWAPSTPARPLPDAWRWESFGGVQVGVPGDWGWTNGSQRIGQWCVDGRPAHLEPAVGRPGVSTQVGCGATDEGVPGELLVRRTGEIVAFEPVIDNRATPPEQGGCDHNGIDDGHIVRHLHRDVLGPLSEDALALTNRFSGVVGNIVSPR
jgi:hypothetical protein